MSTNTPPLDTNKTKTSPFLRALLGLLLLLPACGLCSSDLFLLTLNTFWGSFRAFSFQGAEDFIGILNYEKLFTNPRIISSFGYTALLIFIHVLLATILPPLMALAVNEFGKKLRLGVRLLFTLPLAFFGPALIMFGPAYMRGIWDLKSLGKTYLLIDGVASFAVACGVGLMIYSMVLRGQKEPEQGGKLLSTPFIITWLVAQLGTIAYTLQSLTVFSNLLPTRDSSPLGYALLLTVRNAQGGLAFALSFLMLILAAFLGIAAALLIIFSKVQLKHEPESGVTNSFTQSRFTVPGWIAIVIGGIAAFSVTLIPLFTSVIKMLTSQDGSPTVEISSLFRIWMNSILPPLLVILLIQLPVTYLGALGIGVARPFGKWSQWLLLLFSPWLFVTSVPVAFAAFENLRKVELIDSLLALTPPILISVPMLFILTLFFSGQETKWREARAQGATTMHAFFKHLIVPSLPLAILMVAFSLLAAVQDLFMPFLIGFNPEQHTATARILTLSGSANPSAASTIIALFGLPLFVSVFVIFAILQIAYLDRLVLVRESQDKVEVKAGNP